VVELREGRGKEAVEVLLKLGTWKVCWCGRGEAGRESRLGKRAPGRGERGRPTRLLVDLSEVAETGSWSPAVLVPVEEASRECEGRRSSRRV
jgi:hypothetical protein